MIARIPMPGPATRFYTVETRRLAGYDTPLPGHDQFKMVAAANFCAGRTIAAGQSCTMLVKLGPTTAGLKTAKLRIPSSGPDEAVVKVNLNGTGL
jgi:hypothetical protein